MVRSATNARTTKAAPAPEVQEVHLPEPETETAPQHILQQGDVTKLDERLASIAGDVEQLEQDIASGTFSDEKAASHLAAIVKNLQAMQQQAGTAHKRFGWISAILDKAKRAEDKAAAAAKKAKEKEAAAQAKAAAAEAKAAEAKAAKK